jgi:uncharacterized protein (DUF1697 family)
MAKRCMKRSLVEDIVEVEVRPAKVLKQDETTTSTRTTRIVHHKMNTKRYAALLRGINVGGVTVRMQPLKELFQQMNFANVQTIGATGNVLFTSSAVLNDGFGKSIEQAVSTKFNYTASVQVYEFDWIKSIVADYKLSRKKEEHSYVVFVSDMVIFQHMHQEMLETTSSAIQEEMNIKPIESVIFSDNHVEEAGVIYWNVLIGNSTKTKFAKLLTKSKYKHAITTRNINTLDKMILVNNNDKLK